MKRNVGETRRGFLVGLGASSFSLLSIRGEAQTPTQLKLFTYFVLSGAKSGQTFRGQSYRELGWNDSGSSGHGSAHPAVSHD